MTNLNVTNSPVQSHSNAMLDRSESQILPSPRFHFHRGQEGNSMGCFGMPSGCLIPARKVGDTVVFV